MSRLEFVNELNNDRNGSSVRFYTNADNSLTVKIQQGTSSAYISLPCDYEKILDNPAAKNEYRDNLLHMIAKMRMSLQEFIYLSLVCGL